MLTPNIIHENSGLLPHPVFYSQDDPWKYPMSARKLSSSGYHAIKYRWFHIPTGKTGVSTLWVPVKRWAELLVKYWNDIGGCVWKYSLNAF